MKSPVLLASWPGIGNIGLIAIEYIRQQFPAALIAEIDPRDFYYPGSISVRNGLLETITFPTCHFYACRQNGRDFILFLSEEQPHEGSKRYAEGTRAYDMANLVLDVAEKYGCERIYTSGAAIALNHHSMKPRVWAVPNNAALLDEIRTHRDIMLMSGVHGRDGQVVISGLNGLLTGVAQERGMDALCILGEIPIYLQGMPLPYPKASRSVLEALSRLTGLTVDYSRLDAWSMKIEKRINELLEEISESLPMPLRDGVRGGLEKLKKATPRAKLTEEDARKAIEEIEKYFRKGGKGNEEKPL